MTPPEYKAARQQRGTLKAVAALLDVHWTTIARRESGEITISKEMELALMALPKKKQNDSSAGTAGESKLQ